MSDAEADSDEVTLWAGRLRPSPAPQEERPAPGEVAPPDSTLVRPAPGEVAPPDSTLVRPATRRAASRRIAAPAETPRNARVPTGTARERYPPRAVEASIGRRARPTAPSAGPAPDHCAARRRRRARVVRMLVLAASVALALVAAGVGVVVLLAP